MADNEDACLLCGGKEFCVVTGKPNRIVQCKHCSFTFRSPRPSQKELAEYYSLGRSSTHNVDDRLRARQAEVRLNYMSKAIDLKKVRTLLDVGCDDGLFLHTVTERYPNISVFGVEPSTHRAESARNMYNISNIATSSFEEVNYKETFDLITGFHVLEHVTNLNAFLAKAKTLMNHESSLCLEIPENSLTRFDLPFGIRILTPGYRSQEHLWFFTAKTFRRLLEQAGFHLITMKFVNFGLQPSVNSGVMKYLSPFFPTYEWISNIILLPLNAMGRGLQVMAMMKLSKD